MENIYAENESKNLHARLYEYGDLDIICVEMNF